MNLIIDFYKELDTLNLIIFWGIIIVIILLLIFSFILINKNKKLKNIVEKNSKYEEEIPIKKELEIEQSTEIIEEKTNEVQQERILPSIEIENDFVVEEHIVGYNNNIDSVSNINKKDEPKEEKKNYEIDSQKTIEIPNKPYQRNVLREMSLSQTSPIGINKQTKKEEKNTEMIKDLEETLNNGEFNLQQNKEQINEVEPNDINVIKNQIKREINNIENNSSRKTEIIPRINENNDNPKEDIYEDKKTSESNLEISQVEILNNQPVINNDKKEKNSSEQYLEEVSRKLAEAEIPDDIERTYYELQQEEDAIISYKELMEKKDSIQTIEEEDAIISIEELMNRNNKEKEQPKEETKLYNLTEEEANDNFIKELKQFRNDL